MKSFSLPEKAQVVLAGESGSGKTTLLHLIAGILKPDSGSLVLAGTEGSTLSESQRDRLRASTIKGTLHHGAIRDHGDVTGVYRLDGEALEHPRTAFNATKKDSCLEICPRINPSAVGSHRVNQH